jgi:hypothetical protein
MLIRVHTFHGLLFKLYFLMSLLFINKLGRRRRDIKERINTLNYSCLMIIEYYIIIMFYEQIKLSLSLFYWILCHCATLV